MRAKILSWIVITIFFVGLFIFGMALVPFKESEWSMLEGLAAIVLLLSSYMGLMFLAYEASRWITK